MIISFLGSGKRVTDSASGGADCRCKSRSHTQKSKPSYATLGRIACHVFILKRRAGEGFRFAGSPGLTGFLVLRPVLFFIVRADGAKGNLSRSQSG